MAITSRSSLLAIKVESSEGTPVAPAGATDFIALQDDFEMTQEVEKLENAEIKSSIGMSKSITGMENAGASFSHYLRNSGTAGTAPNYGDLLQSAFGTETVRNTDDATSGSSTVSVLNVGTGTGQYHPRGSAVLIKDATNGWNIRPVHSVSTDALTLGFTLAAAPATATNIGKHVTYSPANSGHQTLTLWSYLGNGGATKMISGGRVTDLTIDIPAAEMINANYTISGIKSYFNPITISASNKFIDFTDDDGTFAASIGLDTYQSPHDLADAIATAMNATASTETYTCTYSDSTGKFTIATGTSSVLSLLWNTGSNTANSAKTTLGFANTDDTSATTYTSDTAISFAAGYTPTYDSADPLVAKSNLCMIGDSTDYACFAASSVSFTITNTKRDIMSICASTGKSSSIINAREVTATVSALLDQYDAGKFDRMMNNTDTRFAYVGGTKTGGNWDAGKCFCIYMPTCTIESMSTPNEDGLVAVTLELKAYVDSSGNGEAYISFI